RRMVQRLGAAAVPRCARRTAAPDFPERLCGTDRQGLSGPPRRQSPASLPAPVHRRSPLIAFLGGLCSAREFPYRVELPLSYEWRGRLSMGEIVDGVGGDKPNQPSVLWTHLRCWIVR